MHTLENLHDLNRGLELLDLRSHRFFGLYCVFQGSFAPTSRMRRYSSDMLRSSLLGLHFDLEVAGLQIAFLETGDSWSDCNIGKLGDSISFSFGICTYLSCEKGKGWNFHRGNDA